MKPHKIVILGGGTAGWMAANLMKHYWHNLPVDIVLLESPEVGIVGVGEGSTPTLKRFFQILGIAESDWMAKCNATYKLDIRFDGWSPQSGVKSYSHPFVGQLDTFTQRAFEVNCRTRRMGLAVNTRPTDFFLNGVLAQQHKGPLVGEHFPFRVEYGYHFDSILLGKYLAEFAQSKGVKHQSCKVVDSRLDPQGNISCLIDENGDEITGDFFIDCSGFAAVLAQKTLAGEFESFDANLFNDRAVVIATDKQQDPQPYTRSTALSCGWAWQIPLQNRTGNGYVYSSKYLADEDAAKELLAHLDLPLSKLSECRTLKMRVGQLKQHWLKNCLALGLAQGFIEPLEATALHLVQISIEMFVSLYEKGQFSNQYQAEYNQKIYQRFERVRDYIVAHYKLNTRNDSQYWCDNRENMQLSDSLRHLLDVWYREQDLSGEIRRQKIENHFSSASWHCLFAGYGVFPPLAANQPNKGDLYKEQNIEQFLAGCAVNFCSHTDNLAGKKRDLD
ncbi:tryptophan halogenase family protein [Catenovulum agarivorans]|uniref:tryptophan halogenase family protein n=1 Tax=Catenovulum agarivorans TaxID=1172192 RepID=UPI0002F947B8|nr:tryptophan halogenase family protein [Catenovulum agarivorans]